MKLCRMLQHKVDKILNYNFVGNTFLKIQTNTTLEEDSKGRLYKNIRTLFLAAEHFWLPTKRKKMKIKVHEEGEDEEGSVLE
ncbi:hypothetical protein E2562_005481 [Oryza meyeriana var. granulata]|uniref:Uncharacterized protein n=1 Tax=Oryza meyeriana var. granulata TaxID=110450 RepID=A0A6G1DER1_9ORYZ|nr:hypothetical protein E2562_005481 [Oryza meyeriana var. granulata]